MVRRKDHVIKPAEYVRAIIPVKRPDWIVIKALLEAIVPKHCEIQAEGVDKKIM